MCFWKSKAFRSIFTPTRDSKDTVDGNVVFDTCFIDGNVVFVTCFIDGNVVFDTCFIDGNVVFDTCFIDGNVNYILANCDDAV